MMTDGEKQFYKIGKTEDGRLWMSHSTDGIEWSEPYVFRADNKEPVFWLERKTITVEGTMTMIKEAS